MIQQIDAPLREDVRLLGNLLGETLKQHAGQDLFNQVEQIRALAKGARDGHAEAEKSWNNFSGGLRMKKSCH